MQTHDEVCGMTIDTETAAASVRFQGKTYYFCAERCRKMFADRPDRYVPVADEWDRVGASGEGDHGQR